MAKDSIKYAKFIRGKLGVPKQDTLNISVKIDSNKKIEEIRQCGRTAWLECEHIRTDVIEEGIFKLSLTGKLYLRPGTFWYT